MRKRREQKQRPLEFEGAICRHTLRPLPVGVTVHRGEVLPIDHELVTTFPDHFRAIARIEDIEKVKTVGR